MKSFSSIEIITRITLWAFVLMSEILILYIVNNWHKDIDRDVIHIFTAILVLLITLRLGKSNLIADFRDICFYDIFVQISGMWLYQNRHDLNIYYSLNYSVLALKFIRLIWPLYSKTHGTFVDWPVIGPFGYFQTKREIKPCVRFSTAAQDKIAYIAIIFSILAIHTFRSFGGKTPLAFWAVIGIIIISFYFSTFLFYLSKYENEFIENREKAAVLGVIEEKNSELHTIEQAKAEAEQSRDEAERAKANEETISRALRTAAHDLRQNIALIGFAGNDMVKAGSLLEREEALQTFYDVNKKVTQAIEQIMYYAKLTTRQAEPRREALEMCQTLYDLCAQWRSAGFEKGIDAIVTYPRGTGTKRYVACDPMLINHILQNLLINAISHAGPKCDRIVLCVRQRSEHYLVQIRDCGNGIAEGVGPDEQANFIAFAQRVYERGVQRGDGHGLGINIVKQMCEVAQITIGLRSRPGRGATFSLLLPRASAALITATGLELAARHQAQQEAKLLWRTYKG